MSEPEKKRLRNISGNSENGLDKTSAFNKKRKHHASGESTISTDSISPYIPTPPDGGYGWVIVFASFMNHIIVDGIAFTFGVFFNEFNEYFGESKGKTALVGALLSGCYLLSAPVAGSLVNKFGCRPVAITGSIVAAFGFSISIFSTNINVLMLTYGIIGGVGLGLLYLPNVVAVSYYFHKRRALATGIAVCGAGVGCFIFAPAGRWLLDVYHWKSAMMIVAGVTLNGAIFGALLRPLEPVVKKPRAKNVFDRLKERVSKQMNISNTNGEASEIKDSRVKKLKKVQEIKMAREDALREEELNLEMNIVSTSSSPNVFVSDKKDGAPPDYASVSETNGKLPKIVISDSKETDEGNTDSGLKDVGKSASEVQATKSCVMFKDTTFKDAGLSKSDYFLVPHIRKLPVGVHREDFARPLYRRDIFYSGSVLHVPEFSSHPNIRNYVKSVTTIPDEFETEDGSYICRCIPISKSAKDTLKQMTDLSLLKNPFFFIPCLANLFGAIGLFIPFVYIAARAVSLDVDPHQAAFLLSIIGITNTGGRIAAGFLADLPCVNALLLHNLALVCAGVICILDMFFTTYPLLCLFAAFFGLCIATWISLTSIVLCELLGLERLTNAFGLLTMTRGIATLVGSPVAGLVYDATEDYNASFHVGGGMMLIGGLLCCILHLPYFHKNVKMDAETMEDREAQRT